MKFRLNSVLSIVCLLAMSVSALAAGSLNITKPGTYGGTDIDHPLVVTALTLSVGANDDVVLNYIKADSISVANGGNHLTIINCTASGKGAYGIAVWRFRNVVIENNDVSGTWGILVRDMDNTAQSLRIRYNLGINISGATGPNTRVKTSFIQLFKVHIPLDAEISYNVERQTRGIGASEDGISLAISGGTPGHPLKLHHNLIDGNFNYPVITAANHLSFSGSGIMAFDPASDTNVTEGGYSIISGNVVLACENQAFACAGGHDIEILGNRAVNDGSRTTFGSIGYQFWNWANKTPASVFGKNVSIHDNFSYWMVRGNRIDWSINRAAFQANNLSLNPTTEAIERDTYYKACSAGGIVFGPCGPPVVTIGDASVNRPASGTASITFTVSLSPAASTDVTVNYGTVAGTASSGAGDYVGVPSGAITIPAGKTSGTISIQVNGGAGITKTFKLSLASTTGATIGNASATGTIIGIVATQPTH